MNPYCEQVHGLCLWNRKIGKWPHSCQDQQRINLYVLDKLIKPDWKSITINCTTTFMPFLLFIKSSPVVQWATSIITIFFMHHQRLFGCPLPQRAFDSNRWHRAGEGQDTQRSYCLVHSEMHRWYLLLILPSKLHSQALSSQKTELSGGTYLWHALLCIMSSREKKRRDRKTKIEQWRSDLPRTVSVRRRFLNNLEHILAHLDWGLASMGSRWLSCILTSTCLGILLALWQRKWRKKTGCLLNKKLSSQTPSENT